MHINLFEYYANYNLGLHFYYKIDKVGVVVIVKIKLIFYFNIIIIIIVKQNEIDIKATNI